MKHTSGPWKIYHDNYIDHTDTLIITDTPAPQTVIAEVKFHFSTPMVQDEANARLIAKAPDMLEACKLALRHIELTGDGVSPDEQAVKVALRSVIAEIEEG